MTNNEDGERELALRELARRHLSWFLRYWFHVRQLELDWNWHLDYLCDLLEAVTRRDEKRVIINIPPRFLKSELVAVAWPAWMIGTDDSPRSAVLSAAATSRLALRDSRRTLQMIQSRWYKNLFPHVELIKEEQAEWVTKGGATRNAAGRSGTITGLGGDHLVWDDLLLAKEANSEAKRHEAHMFLDETLPSRHNDKRTGTIVGIMQRLHEEDPTGHIMRRMRNADADQYRLVVLPNEAPRTTTVEFRGKVYATRKPGDLLFPARFGLKETSEARATMKNNYDGQYQQSPTKQEGNELNVKRLVEIDKPAEAIVKEYGMILNFYIDLASKEKQVQKDDPDYSVIGVMGRDYLDRIHLVDLWRKQCRADGLLDQLLIMWKKWKPRRVKGEAGAIKNVFEAVVAERWKAIGKRLFVLDPLHPSTDKVQRAQPLRAVLHGGSFCVPAGALWLPELKAEWAGFPNASHDDQVDVPAYGVLDLQDMKAAEPPTRIAGFNNGADITGHQLDALVTLADRRKKDGDGDFWTG